MQTHSRHYPLEGTTNLRDLGGYRGQGGRHVKWGVVFRGDHLAAVCMENARDVLANRLHIRHTFDLRGAEECAVKGYNHSGIERHSVPVDPLLLTEARDSGRELTADLTQHLMLETYRHFATKYAKQFGEIFRFIIREKPCTDNAILIHCTAGKDRTGWMCALLLSVLGVDRETIMEDYMLTNSYYKQPSDAASYRGGLNMSPDAMKILWTVQKAFLNAGFGILDSQFGGVENYLRDEMGLTDEDIAQLHDALLE